MGEKNCWSVRLMRPRVPSPCALAGRVGDVRTERDGCAACRSCAHTAPAMDVVAASGTGAQRSSAPCYDRLGGGWGPLGHGSLFFPAARSHQKRPLTVSYGKAPTPGTHRGPWRLSSTGSCQRTSARTS